MCDGNISRGRAKKREKEKKWRAVKLSIKFLGFGFCSRGAMNIRDCMFGC